MIRFFLGIEWFLLFFFLIFGFFFFVLFFLLYFGKFFFFDCPTCEASISPIECVGLYCVTITYRAEQHCNYFDNGTGTLSATEMTESGSITYTPNVADLGNIVVISLISNDPDGILSDCEADTATALITIISQICKRGVFLILDQALHFFPA